MSIGLDQFLADYPEMSIHPSATASLTLNGIFSFCAQPLGLPELFDRYALTITVPTMFPHSLPRVVEVAGRIPRDGNFHVNGDGSLCLGSPLRLLMALSQQPSLSGFAAKCLVPYLYAITHKVRYGGAWVFDELAHGAPGAHEDYKDLFGVKTPAQARAAFELLGMKERHANKRPCPCGCGKRVGQCSFNLRVRKFRGLANRSWFRSQRN